MTHNEYITKHKDEIDWFNWFFSHFFFYRAKEEALRADFMAQYEGRELSNKAVTEDGRVVS